MAQKWVQHRRFQAQILRAKNHIIFSAKKIEKKNEPFPNDPR